MSEELVIKKALAYAGRHELTLAERLGFGIHGIIHVAENKSRGGKTAVKAHFEAEPYHRERAVYERLRSASVTEILGFNVPQMLRADDDLLIIEMTIVTRPFILDFAGAFLDLPPSFSEEIWNTWELEKRDQFESRWATVCQILGALEEMEIFMVDVSPSNIAFAD
jgi:hypothetical protein